MIQKQLFHIFFRVMFYGVLGFYLANLSQYLWASEQEILYIRTDIKTINGRESESNLLMVPAQDDYRTTTFTVYEITGSCPDNAKPDPVSAAKHDAFKQLLTSFGAKSIRNNSVTTNARLHDESVLSYEGFIKTPYKIRSQGYTHETKTFSVVIEVSFAPLAHPPEWTFRYFKKKLYETLHNMVSVFR